MLKITKKQFLDTLNNTQVSLLAGAYTSETIEGLLERYSKIKTSIINSKAINTGLFIKTSQGYKRKDSYATLKGVQVYNDNNIYLLFTQGENEYKNNAILLRKEE